MDDPQLKKDWMVVELVEANMLSHDTRELIFKMPEQFDLIPGQYVDIRLTAPDGHQAVRSYSVMSSPSILPLLELGVQIVPDGEVSPFLGSMPVGTMLEMRGPIGKHFIWDASADRDVVLLAGGVGLVPLLSMLRSAVEEKHSGQIMLLYAAKTMNDLICSEQLFEFNKLSNVQVLIYLSREERNSQDPNISHKRLDSSLIKERMEITALRSPLIYICGSTRFVGGIGKMMREIQYPEAEVRIEGFG